MEGSQAKNLKASSASPTGLRQGCILSTLLHVVIECPRYKELRKLYIPQHLTKRPSMLKLTQFLNTENMNEITAFGKFCFRLFRYYDNNFL